MKIGIYHPFSQFPDNYSLTHVVREQMLMITENGHECHFITHKNFREKVPEGVKVYPVLPNPDGVEVEKTCSDIISTLDAVLTHDVAYMSVYNNHAAAIKLIAEANPQIKWFHWAHSAPNTLEQREALPNSIYVGMNYSDLRLLAQQFGVPVARCQVVYNPRSPDIFHAWHKETKEFVDTHKLLECDILMTYPLDTGRFDAKGGSDVMLLVDCLNEQGKNAKVVFVNAAANDPERKKKVEKWSENKNTVFTSKAFPQWAHTAPNWFVHELMQISDVFPLFSISEGCSLTMLEAGLSGVLFLLNEDFPPMLEFANVDEAMYFKLGSTRQKTNHVNRKEYMAERAKWLIYELATNKALRFKRKVLKTFNRQWIWENQLAPLLELNVVTPRPHEEWWTKNAPITFLDGYDEAREPLFKLVAGMCDGNVLDVGAGSCKLYPYLKDTAKSYTMLEITKKFVLAARKTYPEINADYGTILDLPYKDKQFDTSVAIALFRHLRPEDMPKAMSELMRVADKTIIGWALIPQDKPTYVKEQGFVDTVFNVDDVKTAIGKPFKTHKVGRYEVYEI